MAGYKLDGTGQSRLILDASAPGMWLNHALSQVLVQTASASSLHSLVGSSAPLALDAPVNQAAFSADDSTLVYLDGSGKLKRANAKNPVASPVLATALSILGMTSDKAVRLSALSSVVEVATGLDVLTSHAVVSGKHLYVSSKLGLWDYPALAP